MPDGVIPFESVVAAIRRKGLVPRGAFTLDDRDRLGGLANVASIVLIGVVGRRGWNAFAASPEAGDGAGHPLDRFSRRVVDSLAAELGAAALYPFGGPPHWPFQKWAQRAEPLFPSPLGLLIHPVYGLWHSFRGALGFHSALDVPAFVSQPNPCENCSSRPCLTACPVGAFWESGYDVAACAGHLKSAAGADCMAAGCLARRVCPVGAGHAHEPDQAKFTMRAFLRAREAAAGAE